MTEISVPRESPLKIPMIMKAHWKAKEPFHLVGEPSTVKSALIKQSAKEICEEENHREFVEWSRCTITKKHEIAKEPDKYFIFEDLRASETDIGELRLQEMYKDQDYITYKYNLIFKVLSNPKAKGVLFFDEMNLAPNMIKAQFYKVYNDRSIGDMPISDHVMICSAGNESSQVRDVVQDSVALTTRRANYFISPLSAEEFVSYGLITGMDQTVIGYLSFQPQDIHELKYDLGDPIGQPCARTWEKLSKILKNNNLDIKEIITISRGYLGPGTATKFVSFVKMGKTIKLEDVIKKPEIAGEIKELQILYAVVTGLLSKFRQGDDKIFSTICKVSCVIKEEVGVYMLRLAKQTTSASKFKKLVTEGTSSKDFHDCYLKFGDLL